MGRENYSGLRRSGRTTRYADQFIQALFDSETANIKGSVVVYDHHGTQEATERLIDIIVRRLSIEHPDIKVEVNKIKREITIETPKKDKL
jgi:hypothetical protein